MLDSPSTPIALTRIWCLFELSVALSQQASVTFWVDRSKPKEASGISLARVDLGTALATNPTNRALIMITLQQGPGLDQANALLRRALQLDLKTRRPTNELGYIAPRTVVLPPPAPDA